MHEEPRLEEQILSKVAEIGLSTKLDASEKIDVDVQTDLLKLILGNADSVEVAGQGLVIQKIFVCRKWNCIRIAFISIL